MNRRHFLRNGLWVTAGAIGFPAIVRAQVMPSARRIATPVFSGSSSTLNNNLVAYWKMDETSDGSGAVTRVDQIGGQDLTDNSPFAPSGTGILGNAVSMSAGEQNYLSHASSATLNTGDIDFTFSFWVRIATGVENRFILCKGDAGNGDEYSLNITSSQFNFWIANGATYRVVATSMTININTWYNVVAWHSAADNTVNIRVNDTSTVSLDTLGTAPDSGGAVFQIGKYRTSTSSTWNGLIDEVGFWKRTLTAGEFTELYNAGAAKTCCPF